MRPLRAVVFDWDGTLVDSAAVSYRCYAACSRRSVSPSITRPSRARTDGIYVFIKSKSMQQILGQSKLVKVASILEEVMIRANNKSRKFTMVFEETKKANKFGAVESLVYSEKIIQTHDVDEVVEFLNNVESKGVKVYALDASTDIGLQVSGRGGILS